MSQRLWVAGEAEVDAAADTVLELVDRAGVVEWLAPEPVDVLRLRGDLRVVVAYAVGHGVVHLADDRSAVAVWLDPPADGHVLPDLRRLRPAAVDDPAYTARVASLQRQLWPMTDTPRPWQLLLVAGVAAKQRRSGRGTRLVRQQLDQLDPAGVPAFAFSFDESLLAVMRSLGFVRLGGMVLPSGGGGSLLRRAVGGGS